MLTAFKQYLLTLKLSRISRKLYLSDVVKFLSSLGTDPGLDLVTASSSYLAYLETLRSQAVAPSMIKRITASLRQFATFIAITYAVPNPLTKLSNASSIPEDKYIKHFTNYLNREQLSPLTIKSYKSDTSLFLDWVHTNLPSTKISEVLSEIYIEKYLNYLRQSQTSSISTIERKAKSLARFKVWYLDKYTTNQLPDNTNSVSVEPLPVQFDTSLATNSVTTPVSTLPPLLISGKKVSSVKNFNYRTALSFLILMLFAATLGIFGYRQFSRDVKLTAAYPSTPVTPSRTLSFQGRLENAGGTPITTATNLTFKLYDDLTAGTQLYSTGVCSITPDADGVFSTQIGSTCGSAIASSVFTENANVWLEVTVAAEILTPRQPIASVAYALNSETLQGFPISSTVSAIRNTVVPMNEWGEIIVGEQNPRMKGVSGTFQISAPSLSFITTTGSNGNISFAPDGTGQINATGNTTTTNFFNVLNAQLTTGSLITGTVANNNTGFKLIDLLSGSSPTSKFSVSDAGNTIIAGTLTLPNTNTLTGVSGYTQFSQGVSVGGGTTYYINSGGTGNLNALTLAGTLTANGQVNLGDGGDAITLNGTSVTFTGVDCTGYTNGGALTTNGSGVLQCSDDDSGGAGTGSNWRSNLGTLSPLNDTWDLLIGGNATDSAKAGFININSGTPTATVSAGTSGGAYLSASGTLATTAKQTLTIGNSTTGNINIGVGSGDLLIGESGTAVDIHFAETANIEADPGKVISLTDIGNITPDADSTSSLGANATSAWLNIYGDNIYQNGNLVCDASGANCPATGTNYWRSNLGSLSPLSDSYDLLLGADATSSAKAGFININSGTPTATVSAGVSGGMYMSASGNLATTAKQTLTIGNSTTGNIILAPGGVTALTASGANLTAAGNLNLTAASNLIFGGTTNLGESTSAVDSGAYLVGTFDEFTNSASTTVQGVLNDLDAALATALSGSSIWTDAGAYLHPTTSEVLGNSASAGANKLAGIYLGDSSPLVFGVDNDFTFSFNNSSSTLGSTLTSGTRLGIGTTSALATFDLRSSLGTIPVASISGTTAQATLIVDQSGIGDIFTASSAGNPRFVIKSNGNVGIGVSDPTSKLQIGGSSSTISNDAGDITINAASNNISFAGDSISNILNATVSGSLVIGGQTQLGNFASTPTAIGAGAIIFNTTTDTHQCYNGTAWYNCGGALYSNTNASVADGSYITVAHNLTSTDLLSGAWINSQGVWKSLDANYKPAIAWEGKDTEKGVYHNEVNQYLPNSETGTSTSTLNSGLIFDTLEDSTKTDSANTTTSVAPQMGDDGSANFATLNQRIQGGRTGLVGGQTLATSTTDNDGQTYLGSNTVNDIYYYDRAKDSVPAVQVELGIDPNWYNGVTLSVATSSATYSPNGTINDKNPNLTPTYNGSLIKVTGTDSTPRTIYITIKSPTTFDWTNYQGDAATGVTITPGTAQSLGATGVSATFSAASYNVGDVFKIASWYIEAESATRGAKQQFPERSNVVGSGSAASTGYLDIIDADTQKLWMRFDGTDVNNMIQYSATSVKALNGKVYATNSDSAHGRTWPIDFVADDGFIYYTGGTYIYKGGISLRNSGLHASADVLTTAVNLVAFPSNDVAAAVIPNQPTQEVTVSGWGYINIASADASETVNLPYKFNDNPRVNITYNGYNNSVPTSLSDCIVHDGTNVDYKARSISNNTFVAYFETDAVAWAAYACYSWTATGTVSPKQFVVAATGTSTSGGTSIINETDRTVAHIFSNAGVAVSQIWQSKIAFGENELYASNNNASSNLTNLSIYYGVHGLTTESSVGNFRRGAYGVGYSSSGSGAFAKTILGTATGTGQVTSIDVRSNSSTISSSSNTIYVGTTSGLTVIQENQSTGNATVNGFTDGLEEELGSVKYYTKDYVSEEMIGDIRGMWPLNNSNTASDFEDVSVKANTLTGTNITASGDSVSGVRGTATDFDGSTEYISCTDASCGGTTKTDIGTGSWSVGTWVKTSRSSRQTILAKGDAAGSYSYALESGATSGLPRFILLNTVDSAYMITEGNSVVSDDRWHYLVGTYDGTTISIYIDGMLSGSSTTKTGTQVTDSATNFFIGSWGSTSQYFLGSIDEPFVTATALTAGQIKNMYQVGYRALQSHGTTLGGGSADANQQLGGTTNTIGVVAPDTNNQYMYVGSNSTTTGALSKIQLNNDTNIKTYNSSANVPTGGPLLVDEDITSLSVGETLNVAGSAASGVKTMGLDNNATATSGNFVSKTYALPKNIGSAVLWVSGVTDSSDGSNTITVKASNDAGATYATCTLVGTDTTKAVPEKEYACTFAAADNDLKVKFEFARGSTKTNTYIVQYGISWLGETGFRIEQADSNNVRLYNFSGEAQNLKLNVTGASAATLASPWTDAGAYLYPTGYETLRVYDGAGSNYLSLSDLYLNFGGTSGSSGYGLRDNGGSLEFKNLSGAWTAIGSGGGGDWTRTGGVISPTILGDVIAATTSATTALTITQTGAFNALLVQDQASDTTPFVIDQSGNVGIGVAAPTQKLEVAGYVVGQRFEDSASSAFFVDPAATGTSVSIDGNIVSDGAFSITSNSTNGNITIDAGSGTVLIGSGGAGKLDAGTIDPPYTINGEKFATYVSGMTGVKEETTGVAKASEYVPGKGYRATLDFAGSLTGSDLWLFSKASNLKSHLDKLVVLLSSSNSGKTWYELDALAGKLHLYSQTQGSISYRLTAPRYDDTAWLNTRDDSSASIGHLINDDNNWSISQELANLFSSPEMVSPSTGDQPSTITSPLVIKPTTTSTTDPALVVDGEIEASTISARLAQLDVVNADLITAKNIVADTITANTIIGLDARIASLSGMTDQQFDSITERIKNRLSSLISSTPTAQDIPAPELSDDFKGSSLKVASMSATIASADIDFATVNNYLAVIGEATITTLNVTNGLYVDSISSKSGKIALASGTLLIDSAGQVAINGDLTVSGNILADSGSFGTLELGAPIDATSSTALGNLLSIYDESGVAVATIDASGSANLASLTTNMITIASPAIASESSGLANMLGTATSNATAGENILISPNTELTINSPYVTADSLIYLTPTTNTDNKVLFVKSKFTCEKTQSPCTPSFTVAIDSASTTDISFNWWIIELARPKESGL